MTVLTFDSVDKSINLYFVPIYLFCIPFYFALLSLNKFESIETVRFHCLLLLGAAKISKWNLIWLNLNRANKQTQSPHSFVVLHLLFWCQYICSISIQQTLKFIRSSHSYRSLIWNKAMLNSQPKCNLIDGITNWSPVECVPIVKLMCEFLQVLHVN